MRKKIHSLMEFFIRILSCGIISVRALLHLSPPYTRGCFVFNALGCLLLLPSLLRFNFPDRQCFLPHSSLSNCNQIDCISCYVIYESKVIFLNTIYRHRCVLIGSTHCDGGDFFYSFSYFLCGLSRIGCVEAKSEGEKVKWNRISVCPRGGDRNEEFIENFFGRTWYPRVCVLYALPLLCGDWPKWWMRGKKEKKRRNSNEPAEGNV